MLTIDDAVKVAMNYIHDHLDDYGIDHEDEELMYSEMEQKCWLYNDPDPAAKRLTGLIMDITPAEICSQIESDNLKEWCKTIQVEMQLTLIKMKGSYNERI